MQGLTQQTLVRSVRAVPQCTPKEIWKPIPGWEHLYQVSNVGRVRSLDKQIPHGRWDCTRKHRGRILTPSKDAQGRYVVNLCDEGQCYQYKVHRLVMLAFVGPCPEGMEVCHNDGNSFNNVLSNLRYDTHVENFSDMFKHGTHYWSAKDSCIRGHLYAGANLKIRQKKNGTVQRDCRSCHATRSHIRRHPEQRGYFDFLADQYYEKYMKEAA